MWVVKLGGSLAGGALLPVWLSALAGHAGMVLVPGGGPFADQVRTAQGRWGFDDVTAHHLALLAMEQYGRMLCALQPGLAPASTAEEMCSTARSGRVAVWMPVEMVLSDAEIPRSWDMTSDSLAAWLCGRLDAEALLLVKSARLDPRADSLDDLARDGVVDPLLPEWARSVGVPVHLLSTQDPSALEHLSRLLARFQ